jgi:hypothetical protein
VQPAFHQPFSCLGYLTRCGKRLFLSRLYIKAIFLPRQAQARDKHTSEKLRKKGGVFRRRPRQSRRVWSGRFRHEALHGKDKLPCSLPQPSDFLLNDGSEDADLSRERQGRDSSGAGNHATPPRRSAFLRDQEHAVLARRAGVRGVPAPAGRCRGATNASF